MASHMASEYTIGELAAAADVPTSTIRFYERARLLSPIGRTASNYRRYDKDSVDRLRFIRAAQASGFALGNIAALLDLNEESGRVCEHVQKLIDDRLTDVRRRLEDLQRIESILMSALRSCHKGQSQKVCAVLNKLQQTPIR
mgnify:CR=1 FL=1